MNKATNKKEQGLNILDLFFHLLSKWPWFVVSVALFGGLAYLKYAHTPFTYYQSTTVIIKDPANKNTYSAGFDRYDNLVNKVNVANEILQFRSKRLMRETVRRTHADINYKTKIKFRWIELYTNSPVKATFPNTMADSHITFTLTPIDEQTIEVSHLAGEQDEKRYTIKTNDTISIHGQKILITATPNYDSEWYGEAITIEKLPIDRVTDQYRAAVAIRQEEEEASILKLALQDNNPLRARAILNTMVTVYNDIAIDDKNLMVENTTNFINGRLAVIEKELGGVEDKIVSFKKENQIIDLESAVGQYTSESQKYSSDVMETQTQLQVARYIKDYLTDNSKHNDLIPANTGISDMNIESQISQYNQTKLKRDQLLDESSERNPIVEELNSSMKAMRQSIISAIDNMIVSLNVRLNEAQKRENAAQSKVQTMPTKQRQILSIERQQKIKESLYLFLLNKREENALSQAMVNDNAWVIDSAEGSMRPIAPARNQIMLVGILLGLAAPATIFLMILFLDTRVHNRREIENEVSIPFLGEIPVDTEVVKESKKNRQAVVVNEKGTDMLSEAFRILRTNLAFMSRGEEDKKVLTLTSFSQSAGKTFISRNLAMSLSFANKKVCMVDLDLRKGTLTGQGRSSKLGITNYLADKTINIDDIIQPDHLCEKVDIIPAGSVAPNPAELLMSERLDKLFTELRKRYDYIIADSVPFGIVADADISNRIADITMFVVRIGRLDRRQLPDLESIYQSKKLKNMALILNGGNPRKRGYGYS